MSKTGSQKTVPSYGKGEVIIMTDILYDCGGVKRADLRLRTRYYGMKTKIYLVEKNHYVIQLLDFLDMFNDIKEDFDYNIRSIGDWVELASQKPKTILTDVEPLTNIARNNEGIFLTNEMFQSLLISKFPGVNFVSIRVEHQNGPNIIITVGDDTNNSDITAIKTFVQELRNAFKTVTVEKEPSSGMFLCNKNVELACTDKNFLFSVTDSEFWFDNVEKIYSGEIGKESLRYFDSSKTKCYMDFSVWNNENINIRSNALLYDTVFLSFPLGSHIDDFLRQQHLKMNDLEEMVERSKLVVLLPNTESRYDGKTIDRLYQINNNAIVSKRGINALMAMFYCELERKYLSFWQSNEQLLEELCKECIKSSDNRMKILYEWLIWPIKAKRDSYELLTSYSPMKLPVIGANKLFEGIQQEHMENSKAMEFELVVNSNAIHIATALQATYFPFADSGENGVYSDMTVSNILGNVINTYQYSFDEQQQSIKAYSEMLDKERKSIYLLKSDNSLSLKNVLDYTDKYCTTITLKTILQDLSKLDTVQQNKKISEYNNLIAEIGKEKITSNNILNYILSGVGFIPEIGTAASIISVILQLLENFGIKRNIVKKKIETGNATTADEVYLLDKLSRVARIALLCRDN